MLKHNLLLCIDVETKITDFSFSLLLILYFCVYVQKYYLDVVTNIHNKLREHKKNNTKIELN